MPIHMPRRLIGSIVARRGSISFAALFVNVTARIAERRDLARLHEPRDARGQHARLAAARAGEDQRRSRRQRDGGELLRIETGQERRLLERSRMSIDFGDRQFVGLLHGGSGTPARRAARDVESRMIPRVDRRPGPIARVAGHRRPAPRRSPRGGDVRAAAAARRRSRRSRRGCCWCRCRVRSDGRNGPAARRARRRRGRRRRPPPS